MLALVLSAHAVAGQSTVPQDAPLRFEVALAEGVRPAERNGRLLVILGRRASPEPRFTLGSTSINANPVLARDADFSASDRATLDATCAIFPVEHLRDVPPGDYYVQAVFRCNRDLLRINAPGNLRSEPVLLRVDPASTEPIRLTLTKVDPQETLPADTDNIKYIKLESKLLSEFHKRPMHLRAAVVLPTGYADDPQRRYPLRVHIGGYGQRYTSARFLARNAGQTEDAQRMLTLVLDGAGPLGDPYQVNSANHGPYGDALTQELIPHVEREYRGTGGPLARVIDGGSTGGWVALALQVFYPDFFNGCWAGYPDGVDFRGLQLINIYEDDNAYLNRFGFERPAKRTRDGDVEFTVRHECRLENVLGQGDCWANSGGQWGAWNATYGPRGDDGRPVPLWDAKTGRIDHAVAEHWKQYDLRMVLERNWSALGPKLRGKIHVWVGEADDYFLNRGVHYLDDFLSKADPPYEGWIKYSPRGGHGWSPMSEAEMLAEMATRTRASAP